MRWTNRRIEECGMYGRGEKCIQNISPKPKGKKPLGRLRCRWKVVLKWIVKVGYKDVDWIHLAEDRFYCWALGDMVMNPSDSMRGREILDQLSK
jgi:hypothetical protein